MTPTSGARTSNSIPAIHCHPLCSAFPTSFLSTPRGQTLIGSLVSGSKNETRKNGTLFSQGILRNVDRSMVAMRSRYPLPEFEMSNSLEYTASCKSQPLISLVNVPLLTWKKNVQNNAAEPKAIKRDSTQELVL